MVKSMTWKQFEIVQFILRNQKILYKASIIGYCEKPNSKIIISGS